MRQHSGHGRKWCNIKVVQKKAGRDGVYCETSGFGRVQCDGQLKMVTSLGASYVALKCQCSL